MARKILNGRVIKGVASRFFVDTKEGVKIAVARKKLKAFGNILIGDLVELEEIRGSFVIEDVFPRRNTLIRPYVSNVDACIIVIAPVPEPDLLLVDKVLINCLVEGIEPILVANKIDLDNIKEIDDYKGLLKIFVCSASEDIGIRELLDYLDAKTVCFAGQSAVGKSSIINAMLKSDKLETDGLTKKIQRGKHTTRQTELMRVENSYLIDTCGFSLLDTVDLEPEKLRLYFDEFEPLQPLCQFKMCCHINEPNCAVKSEVGISVSEGRYNRYKTIYEELVERKEAKFQ